MHQNTDDDDDDADDGCVFVFRACSCWMSFVTPTT